MSHFVLYLALFALVALLSAAAGMLISRAASRANSASRLLANLGQAASLVAAMVVFGSVLSAAVAFPQSAVGFLASSPEAVEISAIVAAVAGALVQGLQGWRTKRPQPGA